MRVGILTISDRSAMGEREDESGPLLAELAQSEWLDRGREHGASG